MKEKEMRVLDLFAGLGGFSSAMSNVFYQSINDDTIKQR